MAKGPVNAAVLGYQNQVLVGLEGVGAEAANVRRVVVQARNLDGTARAERTRFRAVVSDTPYGAASGSAVLAGVSGSGLVLAGGTTATIDVETDEYGALQLDVTEAAVGSRYLQFTRTFLGPFVGHVVAPVAMAFA